jgi:hypothetical protein
MGIAPNTECTLKSSEDGICSVICLNNEMRNAPRVIIKFSFKLPRAFAGD